MIHTLPSSRHGSFPRAAFARPSSNRAFTLIELLTVIAIIGILAAIVIGSVSKVREMARQTQNAAVLRGLGMASITYANDNRGRMPIYSYDTAGARPLQTTRNTLNLAGGPHLLLGGKWPGGAGSSDYLPSPDAFFGPFTPGFNEGRLAGTFAEHNGVPVMGYLLYSLPGVTDANGVAPFSDNIANDRIDRASAHPRTPVYADLVGSTYGAQFTGSKSTVTYLDGSVRSFRTQKLEAYGPTLRIKVMAGLVQ